MSDDQSQPLSAEELAELRRVAEAATPGTWSTQRPNHFGDTAIYAEPDGSPDVYVCCLNREANAAHIAAFDPPTAKRLLDMVERQRDALADVIVNNVMNVSDAVAQAVADEREACAKLAEGFVVKDCNPATTGNVGGECPYTGDCSSINLCEQAATIAEDIRARGGDR